MKNLIIKIALTLILFCTIPIIKVSADFDPSNFGALSLDSVMQIARNYVQSHSSQFGGSYSDFYICSHGFEQGLDQYNVYFFNSDTISMTGTNPFTYSNNNVSIKANLKNIHISIDSSNGGRVSSAGGSWNSFSMVYYAFATGSFYSKPTAPGNFFSTISINCSQAPLYNIAPTTLKSDNFYSYKDNVYNMVMGVSAGPDSDLVQVDNAKFYSTDLYWIDYSFKYNNSTITYRLPSYSYARLNSQAVLTQATDNIILPLYNFYTTYSFQNWGRGIAVYIPDSPVAISDASLVDFTDLNRLPSENVLSVNELYQALKNDYSDLTIDDCLTDITAKFVAVANQTVKYTTHFDFTSLKGSPVPDDTNSGPDQTNPYDQLNNWLSSNNYYLSELVKGEPYVSNGMALKAGAVNIGGLSTISMPDFDLRQEELDNNSMSFLGRLVEWWYSSPFGLIALVALTFLIIRTIIW